MHRFPSLLFAALLLTSFRASAQKILPSSAADWQGCAEAAAGGPGTSLPAPPDSGVLAEYGLRSTESASYCRGSERLSATLYQTSDPSGAYGLYSYLRSPAMSPADFTEHSSLSNDQALVLDGNFVLEVCGAQIEKDRAAVDALIASTQANRGAPLPTLWQDLPQKDIVEGTDRYILGPHTLDQLFPDDLGDSVGFSRGAEAELARYRLRGHDLTLVIVDFPTPQMAEGALADIGKRHNVNGSKTDVGSSELFAERQLTLLAIVAGAPSEGDAQALLGQVHSGTVLTWNEPTFQFEEPSIETMVVGAIVGTGVICLFTIIASLAFGGFRLMIKRAMPGKVFDRASEVQVLQLGLGSKPINAQDFYDATSAPLPDVKVDKNLPDRIALRIFR
jgi:hypothetical protein